jgi:hypothetical protein
MQYDICPQFEWSLKIRAAECIVDRQGNMMFMSQAGQCTQVAYTDGRV